MELSLVGLAGVCLPSCMRESPIAEPMIQPQNLLLIWEHETIVDVGKKYRRRYPGERRRQKLTKLLTGEATHTGESELFEFIEENITRDFEEGNTVIIEGWILSVTEARQCALYSIIQSA